MPERMPALPHRLHSYGSFTAVVVGDFMLDQHVYGAAEKLSPDAPVPVLHATRFDDQPGGSAHVARCLSALKANVRCFGVVGSDAEGASLRSALESSGCAVDGIIVDDSRPTTIKRSMIGLAQHRHPQKMFRVDIESRRPLDAPRREQLLAAIEKGLDGADVVCLEDYNKGVLDAETCRTIIDWCRARELPVLVDPAAIEDYGKYRGATAITPNRSEAEKATGLSTPTDASAMHNTELSTCLLADLELDAIVLTLDRHGALLHERGGTPQIVPTTARHVYDVTGAGDIVLAALAGGIANGLSWIEAVTFANAAAGLEVEVFGAKPIPFAEVHREVMRRDTALDGKVRSLGELAVELAVHREAGQKIIFTNGCFDVIHAGHVGYLREAGALGDILVVGINSDAQVHEQKGIGRPIYAASDRLEILAELQCVDYVTVFEEPTAERLLRELRPDIYVKGGDYTPEQINEHAVATELGIEIRVLGERPGLSSSKVVEKMRDAEETPAVETVRRDATKGITP
jgi:D-beta-D-heptose 7-phosphate kinase/D-beta-D-heptose 1-phosphate adenosyltransferase